MGVQTVGLFGHSGAGKTSLAESLLFRAGALDKPGAVDNGSSLLDFEPEERERKTSIATALASLTWREQQLDLMDTPGNPNFIGAAVGAVRVSDGAVLLCSAEPGLQGETDFLWSLLDEGELPRLVVINRIDRDQADFEARLAALNEVYEGRLLPVTLPLGSAENLTGIVDLVHNQAYDCTGPKPHPTDIPAAMTELVAEQRYRLLETVAEADDGLLEKYLDTEELSPEEILHGLRVGTQDGRFVPVYAAAATRHIGTDFVLDALVMLLPDGETRRAARREQEHVAEGLVPDSYANDDFAALVFRTRIDHYAGKLSCIKVLSGSLQANTEVFNPATGRTERPAHLFKLFGKEQREVPVLQAGEIGALPRLNDTHTGNTLCAPGHKVEFAPIAFPQPVMSFALSLEGKGDEEKLASTLHRLIEEDPTLSFHHDGETGDFLVSGMGQIHLELMRERLQREFNLNAVFGRPQVPYRETIRAGAKAQGKYKKQTGGRGQYGDCWLELRPNGVTEQLEFASAIVGGVIPKTYIPAVEKGVQEAMSKGVVAGYPVIGVACTVFDGSYHDVDSSEMAFKIAGSMAFKKAMEDAHPVLLEPLLELEIVAPADTTGDVMGDINARRGRVLGMDSRGRSQVVRAEVPMAEALTYANELRALTSGQGHFTQRFSRYEEVPQQIATRIIEERRQQAAGA